MVVVRLRGDLLRRKGQQSKSLQSSGALTTLVMTKLEVVALCLRD